MAYGPPFYGIRTPPFMPYEPFLLGVGVVFNLLRLTKLGVLQRFPSICLERSDNEKGTSQIWEV